ncbi:MAG: DMT family transporter, partial [Pseudomonadota bacterium]
MTKQISATSSRAWFGPLMVLMGGICIGLAPIGLRLGLDDLGPQAIAFWRFAFALPILFVMVVLIQRRLPPKPNKFVIIAGIFFALELGLWHWSLTFTTVANATFMVNLGNIGVGLTAWIFLKERPGWMWVIAILIACLGAAALSLGGVADGKTDLRGDLIAIAAAIGVSCYVVAAKVARRTMGGLEAIFWLTLVETFVAIFLVLAFRENFLPDSLSGFIVPLFLAIVVHVGGQGLIILGLGHTPTAIAGVLILVQPVVAAAISWQLFDEPLTPLQAGGGFL